VWLQDAESGRFYSAAALDLPPYLQEPVRMTGASCYCIDAFRDGSLTPESIRLIKCSRLYPAVKANDTEATQGLSCHASIPLSFQEKPLGIMNVTGPAWRALTPDELRLLSTIAYQVGIAIERARLAEQGAELARAEERGRLAREIHDTLAQGLTGIALHLEGALTHLEKNPTVARERLRRALELTRESLEEARRAVGTLRAAPLAGRSLHEALRALARSFTADTGIRAAVGIRIDPGAALPERVEPELYRIAQEALANVRRHARATTVRIGLQVGKGRARLLVRDDGAGFDPSSPRAGQGILVMRERAALLGGRLRLTSRCGRGTLVTATLPLGEEAWR
jgi:signal transduction histidine kinase